MNWQGRISGTDGLWGDAGASRLIAVDDAAKALPIPSKLVPEAADGDRLHLSPIGPLSAQDRLVLAGFQHLNPHWDGLAIMVGTDRTHWATLSAREVIHAQTSALPQVAAKLELTGVLADRLDDTMDRPERLLMTLGAATSPGAQLGALMGAEIGSTRMLWLGQQAVLIGEGPLVKAYATALQSAHVPVILTDRTALIPKGFEAVATVFPDPTQN
ncbi:2-dehydro-3-deoxygalactonokinase [Pseudooceanicola sp. MF1-13]|uniref:2-dehydro-3-deoxygalactonokinase n=1 Tax=Pseudooceanicola sp. MF1-13 TaxID=3379095 RepID=UPI003891A7A3